METTFAYAGRLKPMLITMVAVSVIELAVVELFVPWAWLRWVLLLVGVWGLVWVARYARSLVTRPHLVRDGRLHLRFAKVADVAVPLPGVTSAGPSLGSHDETVEVTGDTLSVSVMGLTNVSLTLDAPVRVDAGPVGAHEIRKVRFYADRPEAAARLLRGTEGIRNAEGADA